MYVFNSAFLKRCYYIDVLGNVTCLRTGVIVCVYARPHVLHHLHCPYFC